MMGPGLCARITPTVSWSWNLAGEPAGEHGMTHIGPSMSRDLQ